MTNLGTDSISPPQDLFLLFVLSLVYLFRDLAECMLCSLFAQEHVGSEVPALLFALLLLLLFFFPSLFLSSSVAT